MELSIVKKLIDNDAVIVKEGTFENLGIIGNKRNDTLLYMDNPAFIKKLDKNTKICLLCNENVHSEIRDWPNICLCIVKDPKRTFYKLHNYLTEKTDFYKKMKGKIISSSCRIDPSAVIQDGVVIGERVVIESHVTIYGNVIIGDDVIIRAGSVIGGEGFQFLKCENNEIIGIKHAGRVRICDNVDIQANCCIDKAVFDDETVIGRYTKLDNLVHIAHNVKLGEGCMLAANAVVAGYVNIGSNVWIGPSAVISNRLRIADNAKVSIGSVVIRDVQNAEEVYGNPAIRL